MSSSTQESQSTFTISIDNETYPFAKNMALLLDLLRKYDLNPDILCKPRVLHPREVMPTSDDILTEGGIDYDMYPKVPGVGNQPSTGRMTDAARDQFIKAKFRATTYENERKATERSLIREILRGLAPDVMMNFEMYPGALAARDANDLYALWPY